ncbi:MAG: YcjF family protein, partial [Gammaproteobacteria bacterium]
SDLVAAGLADVGLVFHLARIYGLPVTTAEAGGLLRTIAAQMALVMGTVWAVHFVASAMKGGTAGLSTLVTGTAQGAVAYYSAYVVGRAAQSYFALGRSWGPNGPKRVVQEILESLDRESLLGEAREQIAQRLRYSATDS